ncbi:MAG: outer membrane beta-barrel protein [bacterium]
MKKDFKKWSKLSLGGLIAVVAFSSVGFANETALEKDVNVPYGSSSVEPIEAPEPKAEKKWDYHLHLGVSSVYDDNISLRPDHEVGDFIWTISPGAGIEFGQEMGEGAHLLLDYTANIIRFMDETSNNSVDHAGEILFGYTFNKLSVGLEQRITTLSDAVVDVGTRLKRQIYDTRLTAKYDVSDKTYVDWMGSQLVTDADTGFSDKIEWNTGLFLNYRVLPKVTLGIGPKFGWIDASQQGNQDYQQALARLLWDPTAKLSFTAEGGVERRDFQDSTVPERWTPVAALGATYNPFDSTQISARAYRGVTNSLSLAAENYVTAGGKLSIKQRLIQKFFCGLSGSYEVSDYYRTSAPVVVVNREDKLFTVRPSIGYDISEWGTIEAFYFYRDNDSNQDPNDFDNHQAGVNFKAVF